jgi:hypothetical protein
MIYTLYQDDGRIVSTLSCRPEDLPLNVTEGVRALEAATESPSNFYVEDGALVAKPPRPSSFHDFDYTTKQWVANEDRAWAETRAIRDRLLTQSDWMVTKAIETNTPMPTGWASYRQALRDITLQTDPLNIVWPVEPT